MEEIFKSEAFEIADYIKADLAENKKKLVAELKKLEALKKEYLEAEQENEKMRKLGAVGNQQSLVMSIKVSVNICEKHLNFARKIIDDRFDDLQKIEKMESERPLPPYYC